MYIAQHELAVLVDCAVLRASGCPETALKHDPRVTDVGARDRAIVGVEFRCNGSDVERMQ